MDRPRQVLLMTGPELKRNFDRIRYYCLQRLQKAEQRKRRTNWYEKHKDR